MNESFRDGELSATQKQGIITCIPKGDKNKDFIKNWRPISLLNVIYKIGSSCIANRIKTVLPLLINEDQSGLILNRYIGDNIRLIYDLINYLNSKNLPGMLLCLDFEKAFDSLDWKFMTKALKAFGFGEDICRWIATFYRKINSTVIVNGQTSSWFSIERGCRQGDPVSPYLFVLCVEILATMIRENFDIKGICINEVEHKISQFADDAQLMNNGDKMSFEKSLDTIEKYGRVSGLFLNTDKTQAIWLGSKRRSQIKYMPHLKIVWNPSQFKILGVWFTQDLKDCETINYNEKFFEVKALFNTWSKRLITPLGRVAILKSLILSKLVHLWILLPDPPDDFVNNLQKMCFRFIWNNKQDKISRKTAVKSVKSGGLGVPEIRKYISALKIMWIRKLKQTKHKWKNIALITYPFIIGLEQCGPNLYSQKAKCNIFWEHVFKAYRLLYYRIEPQNTSELLAEPVLHNDRIKIGNKVISYTQWIEKGVYNLANFVGNTGKLLTFTEFRNKYGIYMDFVTYSGLILSLKKYIRKTKIQVDDSSPSNTTVALRTIYSITKGTKAYYNILNDSDCNPNCCAKWTKKSYCNVCWKSCFLKIHKIDDIKLKWLQMGTVHRVIATNVVLKKMGIINCEQCTFCDEKDSIEHFLWQCCFTRRFWRLLENLIGTSCETACNIKITENLVLFGIDSTAITDKIFDLIILLAKQYLYRCKFEQSVPLISVFRNQLKLRHKLEEYNSKITFQENAFNARWHCYRPLLLED